MNNTKIINIFDSDNSNIACINTYHCQIMTTTAYKILKFKSIINNDKLYILFICYFQQDRFFRLYQFYGNTAFIISILQKDFHQDNLSFLRLQFCNRNCVNVLAGNICLRIQAKHQQK